VEGGGRESGKKIWPATDEREAETKREKESPTGSEGGKKKRGSKRRPPSWVSAEGREARYVLHVGKGADLLLAKRKKEKKGRKKQNLEKGGGRAVKGILPVERRGGVFEKKGQKNPQKKASSMPLEKKGGLPPGEKGTQGGGSSQEKKKKGGSSLGGKGRSFFTGEEGSAKKKQRAWYSRREEKLHGEKKTPASSEKKTGTLKGEGEKLASPSTPRREGKKSSLHDGNLYSQKVERKGFERLEGGEKGKKRALLKKESSSSNEKKKGVLPPRRSWGVSQRKRRKVPTKGKRVFPNRRGVEKRGGEGWSSTRGAEEPQQREEGKRVLTLFPAEEEKKKKKTIQITLTFRTKKKGRINENMDRLVGGEGKKKRQNEKEEASITSLQKGKSLSIAGKGRKKIRFPTEGKAEKKKAASSCSEKKKRGNKEERTAFFFSRRRGNPRCGREKRTAISRRGRCPERRSPREKGRVGTPREKRKTKTKKGGGRSNRWRAEEKKGGKPLCRGESGPPVKKKTKKEEGSLKKKGISRGRIPPRLKVKKKTPGTKGN